MSWWTLLETPEGRSLNSCKLLENSWCCDAIGYGWAVTAWLILTSDMAEQMCHRFFVVYSPKINWKSFKILFRIFSIWKIFFFSIYFEDLFIILQLIQTTNLMASAMSIEMSTVCIFLVINFWLSRGIVLVTITSSMSESCNKNGELSDKLSNNQSEKVTLHKRYQVIITPSKFFVVYILK